MGYRYIGSKARIVDKIVKYIPEYDGSGVFVDAFCGMGHVAIGAAEKGWPVLVNDQMLYAEYIAKTRLLNTSSVFNGNTNLYTSRVNELNNLEGIKGYFWNEYSPSGMCRVNVERKYFTEENAKKIDAIRQKIKEWYDDKSISENEHILLLVDLMEAINSVANIAGTYGCFLAKWSEQSQQPIMVKQHEFLNTPTCVYSSNLEVNKLDVSENDIVYLDPPYTKRQYASYYHILETIAHEDFPDVEGVAGLRPWKTKASAFCYKTKALSAMIELVKGLKAKRILISYSNDGHIRISELVNCLNEFAVTEIIKLDTLNRYKSYDDMEDVSKIKEFLIIVEKN